MTILRKAGVVLATVLCAFASSSLSAAETVLAEADFSTLTNGSEDEPEIFKYMSSFTGFTGWSIVTGKTGEAGGSLYLADGGNIKSPYLSGVSTTGGAIKISAEVKLNKAEIGMVQLAYGYSSTMQTVVEGTDWQTIEFIVTPTSSSQYSNYATLSPQWLADGIFVKTIKIAQSPEFLGTPTVNQPTNADGTSFTATWKSVSGATKYFIDVYSFGADGQKVYFIENQECTTTSYKVEGLDPAVTYFFVVRAANETGTSADSEEIEVVKYIASLEAPVLKLVSCDQDGNFVTEWDAIADAEDYTLTIFRTSTMAEAGEATVMAEDFNALTTGSLSSPEYIYERHLAVLNEPGWSGYNMACIDGAIGLTPYSSEAYLITPAINLSADEGKFSILINMAANNLGTYYTDEVVTITTIDADNNESEPVTVTIDKAQFADYTINLTGGTAATKIKISSASSRKIFIDNFEVKQVLPAGSQTTNTYLTEDTEATTFTGKVEFDNNATYKMVAVANGRTVSAGAIAGISSAASEPLAISITSGIEEVAASADEVAISKAGEGVINVTTPEAVNVTVYDLNGRVLGSIAAPAGSSSIAVAAKGIVIVKAGDKVAKISL